MSDYRKIDSFDRPQIDAVGVGYSTVAVASGQRITLVTGTDRSEFEHDEPVTDIALEERVVVLSSDRLTAYTRDGARVWSRTFDSPHAVTTLPDEPTAGVLESDRLRVIDLETGQESVTVERRRPGQPRDDRFIGIESGFVAATWSFLRCVDTSGEEVFDRNLNTAIRDIGHCGGVLVAGLKNGQLKGFDVQTGERRWETELPIRQITHRGDRALLVSTDDGVKSIDRSGSIGSIGSLTTGDVYASQDGSVVCSIRKGSVGVHVPGEELIDVEILTDSVGVGGTIDVEVTNLGDTLHDVTVQATLDHADLSPDERHLELTPRDPTLTDFPIESVRTDGETEFTVRIDDRDVADGSIEISDAAQSTVTAEAELRPTEIRESGAILDLSVENTGTIPLDSISVLETGEQGSDIEPGETWTRTITKPYEPGRTITVGMEVVRGNRRTEFAPTCRLPEQPSIELEQKRDALHGRIDADERVVWSDELVIDAPGADRVRSPIEIEDGTLLVVLPVYEEGIARIGLSKLGISERARMSGRGPLADLTRSSGRSDRSTERNRTANRSTRREREAKETVQSPDPDRRGSAGTEDAGIGGSVSIDRELSADTVSIGHAATERLAVENRTNETVEPAIEVGEQRLDPGEIGPGETWAAERTIVPFSTEVDEPLPEATLEANGSVIDRAPAETFGVTDRCVAVRGVVDPTDGRYEIELENGTGADRRLTGLEIDDRPTGIETRPLESGDRTTIAGTTDSPPNHTDPAARATVFVTDTDGSSNAIDTLAVVREQHGDGADDAFERKIGSSTQVAGDYGTVVLVFENASRERLSDVRLEASGEPINDMLYSQAHRETLTPGERIEHYVDLKAAAGTAEFEITASHTTESGEERSRTFRVAGPAVETEDEWTDEHRTAWTLEPTESDSGGGFDVPKQLSTEFHTVR